MNEIVIYVIIAVTALNALCQTYLYIKNKTYFGSTLFSIFCFLWIAVTLLIPIQHRKAQAIEEMKILTEQSVEKEGIGE